MRRLSLLSVAALTAFAAVTSARTTSAQATSRQQGEVYIAGSHLLKIQTVKMKDLPPAVQKTVTDQSKGAKLRGVSREIEDGKTEYEAELIVDGHSRDVTINPEGEVIEVEEQVELSSLPDAVQAGLKKLAGKGRITKVESVTHSGKLDFYEAQVRTGTKHSEVKVSPEGQPVKGEWRPHIRI